MKIKNSELELLASTLMRFGQEKVHRKLAYGIVRNKKLLETCIEALGAARELPETYKKFDEARLEMCRTYSEKEENGEPKTKFDPRQGNIFDIPEETKEEFETKMNELKEEYKEAHEEKEKHEEELKELLEEEVEFDFYLIDIDFFPEEMSPADMEVLMPLIKE